MLFMAALLETRTLLPVVFFVWNIYLSNAIIPRPISRAVSTEAFSLVIMRGEWGIFSIYLNAINLVS